MQKVDHTFIAPAVKVLDIDGRDVEVRPISIAQLPALTGLIHPILDELLLSGPDVKAALAAGLTDGVDEAQTFVLVSWLTDVVTRHTQSVINAVAVCTRQDPGWVGELLPDRLIALAMVAVEINVDFFGRAWPTLRGLANGLSLVDKLRPAPVVPTSAGPTASIA